MDKRNDYEDSLNKAQEVHFHLTDNYDKSPAAIKLGFQNPQDGIHGYNGIHKIFKNLETTIVIFKGKETVDISIVSKDTADTINIKNLKFDLKNLDDFKDNEPTDRKFMLLMGPIPASDNHVIFPVGLTKPLVIDKYSIIQRP